jgi:hypothetical protein
MEYSTVLCYTSRSGRLAFAVLVIIHPLVIIPRAGRSSYNEMVRMRSREM